MARAIEYNGREYEFPDRATDEQIATYLRSRVLSLPKVPPLQTTAKPSTTKSAIHLQGGKDFDAQRKATVLERGLSAMMVPTNLMAGVADKALEVYGPNPDMELATGKPVKRSPLDVVKEGARLGLENKTTFGDVYRGKLGMNPLAAGVFGFGTDLVVDPISYTGIGGLTKAGRAAKAAAVAGEFAGDLPAAAKFGANMAEQAARGERALVHFAGKPVVKGARVFKAASALGKIPGAKTAVGGFRAAFDPLPVKGLSPVQREGFLSRLQDVEGAQNLARRDAVAALKPQVEELRRISTANGVDPAMVERAMNDAAELDDFSGLSALHPDLLAPGKKLVEDAAALNTADFAAKRAQGVPVSELQGLSYTPHVASPEMNAAMRNAGHGGTMGAGRQVTERHGAQLQRNFIDIETGESLTKNEANDIITGAGTGITGHKPAAAGFLGVPSATAEAHIRSARSIKSAEIINDYARAYGRVPKDAVERKALEREGWAVVPNELASVGDKVLFPKPIAESLGMMHQGVFNPKGPVGDGLRGLDELTNGWKALTLGLFPSFHTRNELDDLFRATAYGGMHWSIIPSAIEVQTAGTALARGAPKVYKLAGKEYTAAELKTLALKHNVTDAGLVGDIAEHLDLAVKSNNPAKWAVDLGRRVGTARENSTRMALFMDRLARGDAPQAAALFTNKILINYTLKTRFEREFAQRLFPFYMYTARNTPLQFEYLLKRPGVAAGVQKLREEAAGDRELGASGAQLPGFLARGLPIHVGESEGIPLYGRLEGQLGISDLDTPFGALEKGVGLLNPFISTPLEMASNRDFFMGKELADPNVPLESKNFLGLPVSQRFALPLLQLVRLLTELDRANPGNVFGTTDEGPAWNPELRREYDQPPGWMRAAATFFGRPYAVADESAAGRTHTARELRIQELRAKLRRASSPGEAEAYERALDRITSEEALVPLK